MSPNEIGPEWQKLCEEHEAARDAYFHAYAQVNQKSSAIGKETINVNPTGAELTQFEKIRHAWQDVIRRMGEIAKIHAEGSGQGLGWPTELGS